MLIISCSTSNEDNSVGLEGKSTNQEFMEMNSTPLTSEDENYQLVIDSSNSFGLSLNLNDAIIVEYNWTPIRLYRISSVESNTFISSFVIGGVVKSYKEISNEYNISYYNNANELLFTAEFAEDLISNPIDSGMIGDLGGAFDNTTMSVCDCHDEESSENHRFDRMENCHQYDYKTCLSCGQDVCTQDIRCDMARLVAGPAYAAGLMMACLF